MRRIIKFQGNWKTAVCDRITPAATPHYYHTHALELDPRFGTDLHTCQVSRLHRQQKIKKHRLNAGDPETIPCIAITMTVFRGYYKKRCLYLKHNFSQRYAVNAHY